MTYNGYVADLFFNACAIAMWAAFLWRVLDGPRFRVWVTVLLAALIGAAYMAATLLLTTVGQLRALMFPVCSLAMAFLLFRGKPGRKLLAVAAELAGSLLMEMMFTPLMIDLQSNDDISVWADPRALIYGVTFLPVLGLGLMLISFIFTRSKNNLSGRQLLVFSAFPITQMVCEASLVTLMFTPPRYEYIPMQLIMSVLFLVSDILLYRTMVRTEQRVQLEVENALLESQLDAQLAHYRDLTAQYEQIRAMRHDIAHHLNTIHALLEAGNLQAASEYSEQLLPAQTYSSRLGACRNPVVDAFLYTRVQDAQARGVPVRADVSLPVELPVSNTTSLSPSATCSTTRSRPAAAFRTRRSRCARTWIRATWSFRSRTPSAPGSRRARSPGVSRSWSAGWAFACSAVSLRSTTAVSGTRAKTIPTPSRSCSVRPLRVYLPYPRTCNCRYGSEKDSGFGRSLLFWRAKMCYFCTEICRLCRAHVNSRPKCYISPMKERSARRAAPREGERSQVAEVLNICIVDPSTIWRHTAREILCRELDANGVRACVDEFYAPESMTSDGGCAYYDVVLADISDRQTREQYLRFFRDLRLTSPQTKLILLSADPLAALDVFECDPDYFVCKLEMETRLSAALRFVLRPCGGELGPCLIVGSRATRHVLSMREILYCEHAQRQTKIVMTTRTVTCSEKLNEIYRRLDPAEFVQTHCSFLVNLSYVKELRRTCVVLRSGVTVPLSRANYARVRQALAQHLSHALGGERPLFTLSER